MVVIWDDVGCCAVAVVWPVGTLLLGALLEPLLLLLNLLSRFSALL